MIEKADVLIWDEFISSDREIFEAVHRKIGLVDKVVVAMGDIRQILPVVKYGTYEEQLSACITHSPLFKYFHIRTLTVNMRLNGKESKLRSKYQTMTI